MTDQSIITKNSDLLWTIADLLRGPYRPSRPVCAIEADIQGLEKGIVRMLPEVTG